MKRVAWIAGVAAVVVGAFVAVGLVIGLLTGSDDPLVLDLEVGTCFDVPESVSDGTITNVETIDCTDRHEAEVIVTGELNAERDQAFPGDAELLDRVDRLCNDAIDPFSPYASSFGILPVAPNEQSWDQFRGRYVCVAIPYGGGSTSGSLVAE